MSPDNPFGGLAFDRRSEQRDNQDWLRTQWPRARVLALDAEGRAPCRESALHWLAATQLDGQARANATFLGLDGDAPLFAVVVDAASLSLVPGTCWLDLRGAAPQLDARQAGLFAYARALAWWQQQSRFCGACGAPMQRTRAGHSARCTASGCGIEQFPRIDPAIIVIVTHGRRCLLGRQAGWPLGRYSTLAGFVEPGESLEDAVQREVAEEAGVRVGRCRYHSSQPWPFPASLMLGFSAEALGDAIECGDELQEARWFDADELVDGYTGGALLPPTRFSVSFRLIADWLRDAAGVDLPTLLAKDPPVR